MKVLFISGYPGEAIARQGGLSTPIHNYGHETNRERRSIPSGCVARRSYIWILFTPRALPAGRLDVLDT